MAVTSHDAVPTQLLDGAVKEYSRDKVYVLTALVLGAITVVEVLTYALARTSSSGRAITSSSRCC